MKTEDIASSFVSEPTDTSSCLPPTEDIYPVQAPYGEGLDLTPPPEDTTELFDLFPGPFRAAAGPLHYRAGVPIQTQKSHLQEPPSPPHTESASPTRSSISGGSSTDGHVERLVDTISAGDDVLMDSGMNYVGLSDDYGILPGEENHALRLDQPVGDLDDMNELEEQFFNFDGAAGSPLPKHESLPSRQILFKQTVQGLSYTPQDAPPSYGRNCDNQSEHPNKFPKAENENTIRELVPSARGHSRKRSRIDQDEIDGHTPMRNGRISPVSDIKMESPPSEYTHVPFLSNQPPNYFFQTLGGSPESFSFNQGSGDAAVTPFGSSLTAQGYTLRVEFPKHCSKSPQRTGEAQVKSRVETQIPVRLILSPPPPRVTKLRLPRHTISKIKYIEDSLPQRSPDTFELHVALVCASAMEMPDQRERALCEARGALLPQWVLEAQQNRLREEARESQRAKSEGTMDLPNGSQAGRENGLANKEDKKPKIDYSKPLFGASVQICEQCMNRERKRAGRKKNKKPDEEQKWAQDEKKRIIVFNTNQVREWSPVSGSETGKTVAADTQMRICCYCRHHGEKDGFQVIFTLRDHNDEVVAQTISSTILITDDHKNTTQTTSTLLPQPKWSTEGGSYMTDQQATQMPPNLSLYQQNNFLIPQPQITNDLSQNSNFGYSTSSQQLQNGMLNQGTPSSSNRSSLSPGHPTKRRKPSKVPTNLAMTSSDPPPQQLAAANMPFSNRSFTNDSSSLNAQQWLNSTPVTPLAAPGMGMDDGFPFRNVRWSPGAESSSSYMVHSPVSTRVTSTASTPKSYARQLSASLAQARGLDQLSQTLARIDRVVPAEGTCRGGIEITVLGSDFVNGLTVMFGDQPATDTTFYSDTTLLCRLPPNPHSGPVVVGLKNLENPSGFDRLPIFTYVDDVDSQLMSLALSVIGMKMKGETGSSREVALSILRENGISSNTMQGSSGRRAQESDLLACLDMLDMDESPHPTRLNFKNRSGQTMLHLAAMLGMPKFAAALLARGANPNLRDKNDYTPLHFAALYNRSDVVRRLLLNRANPGLRTRNGETAADLGQSDEIVRATRTVGQIHSRQHSRSNSVSSDARNVRSRSGSSVSLPPMPQSLPRGTVDEYYDSSEEVVSSDADDESSNEPESTEGSGDEALGSSPTETPTAPSGNAPQDDVESERTPQVPSPGALYAAWQERVAASLQALQNSVQQNMHQWNIHQWNAADYQHSIQNHIQNQMARWQIQNPMARWNLSPPFAQQRDSSEYKWSELFNPPAPLAPPAYDELYPEKAGSSPTGEVGNSDEKVSSETEITITPVEDTEAGPSTPLSRPLLVRTPSPKVSEQDLKEIHRRIALGDRSLSTHQQEAYSAHARKIKRIQSDRRLYFFWLPALILIMTVMTFSWGPKVWETTWLVTNFVRQVVDEPHTVRDRFREMVSGLVAGG